jgi:hypothetical protein
MIHLGRRRNSNEYCGAYGHNFTFREMQWLANWLLVRGCNLLYPHAFYYSVRGPRIDERPPDVGPNNVWWPQFKPFADATSRLSWLNADCQHVCELAILGLSDYLPWRSAKICFEHQFDFNYLEARHLWEDAVVSPDGIRIAGMLYRALIVEMASPAQAEPALQKLQQSGRLIRWNENQPESVLLADIERLVAKDVRLIPHHKDIRIRHVRKQGMDCYLIFNEGEGDISVQVRIAIPGEPQALDVKSGQAAAMPADGRLFLRAHEVQVVVARA